MTPIATKTEDMAHVTFDMYVCSDRFPTHLTTRKNPLKYGILINI